MKLLASSSKEEIGAGVTIRRPRSIFGAVCVGKLDEVILFSP